MSDAIRQIRDPASVHPLSRKDSGSVFLIQSPLLRQSWLFCVSSHIRKRHIRTSLVASPVLDASRECSRAQDSRVLQGNSVGCRRSYVLCSILVGDLRRGTRQGRSLRICEEAESDPQDGLPGWTPSQPSNGHPGHEHENTTSSRAKSLHSRTLSRAKAENPSSLFSQRSAKAGDASSAWKCRPNGFTELYD
ncbi:uncharacterized protein NECHADRAFT_82028 [Fusarium vanettenii 77-13-4]|uniref:Uncharacterized protein n=1 Tax=Fusarium vanettenii (strain ATCC MYA-4622 / CBS 123669 / FGSC 9596 / NRRL 45880 / 77-13-4) TaxID=660122 RepID=C7ZAA3_FUSV7|nr:uncharacterized protein NECHADRAFT_82028 [Fusarium vanettenii 77-13-4]EEU39642.1 predicted protein [Fusarium vanettenii 77-13-4]